MTKRKSKPKIKSETLEINVMGTDPAELAKLAAQENGGLDQFGIYPAKDGRGVTFGSPRQPEERTGEGLPKLGKERGVFGQWHLELDMRVSYDREGNCYLEVAQPGSGTFHQFEFSGIEFNDAVRATGQFNNRFNKFLIYLGIESLFTALFWERAEKKDRDEAYDAIIASFENYFKNILKPKRTREIESRELQCGLRLTTYEQIETGREPKTKVELEQEKKKFISDVFAAFNALKPTERTQYRVAMEIFDGERNKARKELEKAIGNRLRKFDLNWRQLRAAYAQENP